MIEVSTENDWHEQVSHVMTPYLLFKHSTTCPISAGAYREVVRYDQRGELPIYLVKVIESRPLSLHLADVFHVPHASPQVILMNKGNPVWNTSHGRITEKNLLAAVSSISNL